jgi:hypothetical protein
MPCVKLHAQLDFDVCFQEDGLFLMHYDELGNPSRVISWTALEEELLRFGNDSAVDRVSWAKEMQTANALIRLGLKLRHAMNAIREKCDRDPQPLPPPQFSRFDDDSDDDGEEWKRP